MTTQSKSIKLKKELTLLDIYAITVGTTLSGGFFLLPGLAVAQAGPATILSYMLAAVPLIPAILCMVELSTAMPKAGGIYFFFERSMGPLVGTVGGFGTWLILILKTAFALIGMGAYLSLLFNGDFGMAFAVGFAVFFGLLNLIESKRTGHVQVFLAAGILLILGWFIFKGLFEINTAHFSGFFDAGSQSILATAGLVYMSFIGVTKISSIAEEVQDPERNLPLGMFLGLGTSLLIYGFGIYVMIGVLSPEQLHGNLTPVASTAEKMVGSWGKILVSIAAIFAFASVTNTGILSASRYPLAMSRDHLVPRFLRSLNKRRVPKYSVLLSVISILAVLFLFNPMKIAKLASTFQFVVFALCCLAVIIMRESQIEAYDPGYRSPFYPWLQIVGIIIPFFFIIEMGWMPVLFSLGMIAVGVLWFFIYVRQRVARTGAIWYVFERLGQQQHAIIEGELRSHLKEKGLRELDPFDEIVTRAQIIDLDEKSGFHTIISKASETLAQRISYPKDKIENGFLSGTKVGATPVSHGVAIPHLRLSRVKEPVLLMVRAKSGIRLNMGQEFWGDYPPDSQIYAIFFLISPEENPGQHLRILAEIASRTDDDNFMHNWLAVENEQQLKDTLLQEERFMSLVLRPETKSSQLIGRTLKEIDMPGESLVAIIRRKGQTIVPRGNTVLQKGDYLIIIGGQKEIRQFQNLYGTKIKKI